METTDTDTSTQNVGPDGLTKDQGYYQNNGEKVETNDAERRKKRKLSVDAEDCSLSAGSVRSMRLSPSEIIAAPRVYNEQGVQTDSSRDNFLRLFNAYLEIQHSSMDERLKIWQPSSYPKLAATSFSMQRSPKVQTVAYHHRNIADMLTALRTEVYVWSGMWTGMMNWGDALERLFYAHTQRGPESLRKFTLEVMEMQQRGRLLRTKVDQWPLKCLRQVEPEVLTALWEIQSNLISVLERGLGVLDVKMNVVARNLFTLGGPSHHNELDKILGLNDMKIRDELEEEDVALYLL